MSRVFIIAEAGVNHNGDIVLAKELVDKAVDAGADAVKFQTFKAENLASKFAPKAEYQLSTTSEAESHIDMLKRLELSESNFRELKEYCYQKGILFLSTPFDLQSASFLRSLDMKVWKLSSGAVTDFPLLREVATYKPHHIILSTGMSSMKEVADAVDVLLEYGTLRESVTLLHCNTEYPTPVSDVNLKAMLSMKDALRIDVGYSDHTMGIEIPIAAVAMGASVIEKHMTLDRNMEGPDHRASLVPDEFKEMVRSIRNVESAFGNGIKAPSPSEKKNIVIARKSIVASRPIKQGEVFSEENLTCKRPATGISPMRWMDVIGHIAKKSYMPDEPIGMEEIN